MELNYDDYGNLLDNPFASTDRPGPVAPPHPAAAANLTYTPVGFLGAQPMFSGSDGKYYQATQYNPDGSPKEYGEVLGVNPSQITPTNTTSSATRGLPGAAPGSGGAGGYGGGGVDASLVAPFTEPFVTGAQLAQYKPPPAFSFPDFKLPSWDEVQAQDPGIRGRLEQGQKAIENNKAYKGTFRTGGAIKDFLNYNQDQTKNEYGAAANRSLDVYGTNRTNAADTYRTNYGSQFIDPYNYDVARDNTRYSRDWQEYIQREKSFRANQDGAYDKYDRSANRGVTANN